LERFVAVGFAATSVRELAGSVGVTQPTLYYHFGSKDGILAALIEPFLADGEALLDRLESARGGRFEMTRLALEGYYDVLVAHFGVAWLVESDRAVRSHPVAGHRLAAQASRLVDVVAGGSRVERRIQAAAAFGAVRRPLRLAGVDPIRHRDRIVGCALAAAAAEFPR
jgi:AcrR family transcriptional regulator